MQLAPGQESVCKLLIESCFNKDIRKNYYINCQINSSFRYAALCLESVTRNIIPYPVRIFFFFKL